jgi:hypothetical protein
MGINVWNANELTKKMATAFSDVMNTVPSSFLSSLFREKYISNQLAVEIDVERGDEKVAVDVVRGADGNLNTYEKFSTDTYIPPLYNEYTALGAEQLALRGFGQNPYEEKSRQERAIEIILKGQMENAKKILRAIEKQASDALFTGKIVLKNGYTIDFARKATHNITVATSWNNPSADPLGNLEQACILNRKDGKVKSDIAIFGKDAWDSFISNEKVQKLLDVRKYEIGVVKPAFESSQAVYQGNIVVGSYKLELYTYPEYYKNTAGVLVPYCPDNQVIVLFSKFKAFRNFGAVDILQESEQVYRNLGINAVPSLVAGEIVPYAYTEKESHLFAGVKSAPLLVPVQIDAITNLNVL